MKTPARALFLLAALVLLAPQAASAQTNQLPHESELDDRTFPPLPLEPQVLNFPDPYFAMIGTKIQLGTATLPERRWWYRAAERLAPFQAAPPADWQTKAAQAARKLDPPGSAADGSLPSPIYRWAAVGPNGNYDVTPIDGPPGAGNAQGRGTAIWTHFQGATAVNKNFILAGFADGGLWKSTDGGATWKPLTDFQPSLAVGALDVLPGSDLVNYNDATIYLGTGEGNFSGPDKDGVGVLKSTDGGKTWAVQPLPFRGDAVGIPGLHRIRRVRIDRNVAGGKSVWAAADGGVYHTADGGMTWTLVTTLPYTGAPAGAVYPGGCWSEYATDFAVGPVNTQTGQPTLVAVFGRVNDATCAATPADSRKNNGVYSSVDGGATWAKIGASGANGFPAIPGTVGRIALLLAPSNPKHAYALIHNSSNGSSLGIFRTLDITGNPVVWTAGSTTNYTSGQGWYDMTGSVDPTNENRLMVGGLDNYMSTDGGATLTKVSVWSANDNTWSHADHHHAVWVDATTYYDANDGGFFIGHVNGSSVTWENRNSGSLCTLQFYGLGQSATNPYKINAGLQDNGHAYLDGTSWRETYGGDGGFAATDQSNDNEAYEEYVYGAIRNSSDGGNSWPLQDCMQSFGTAPACPGDCELAAGVSGVICVPDQHTAFIAWFMLDAHNQNAMYVGTNWLYRNMAAPQAGKVWQRITTDGANGDFVLGAASSRAYISSIHTPKGSPVNVLGLSQVIYVGTSTGRIWKTSDAGLTWTDLTKAPLPVNSTTTGRFLTSIDTDPADVNRVVITYSGWSNSTVPVIAGHVFRSNDGGVTWTDISGALPDEPFNSVAVNPNGGETGEIYAASDSGVFVNGNGWSGNTWVRSNSGLLPHVSVNMLQFTGATTPQRLRAATHGRGIWEMFRECAATVTLDKQSYVCNDTVNIVVQDSTMGAGSQNVLVLSAAEPKGETVTLTESPAGSGHFVGSIALSGGSAVKGDGKLAVFNADRVTARYVDATPCPNSSPTVESSAVVDCNNCTASTGASGGNLQIDASSVATSIQGGDGDEFLDNCETGVVTFTLKNDGAAALKNVRVSNVVSPNPGVRVQTLPAAVSSSLAACASATARFTLTAGGLAPGETLTLRADVTSDELAARGLTRSVTVRFENCEQDYTFFARKTFSFENDNEGWTKVSGVFDRTDGPGANQTLHYIASSTAADNACDEIRSPVLKLSATSTLSLYNQYLTEPINFGAIPPDPANPTATSWFDRANAALFDVANTTRTPIVPSGGRTYLASGPNGACVTQGQVGWAGPGPGWLESTWTASDLNAAALAGRKVRLSLGYATDTNVSGVGFWFDEVTFTNVSVLGPDQQSNVCPVDLDDNDGSIEYTGGWFRKSNASASNGGYHERVGNNPQGAAARIVFQGSDVTYFYAVSNQGGTADIYLDGSLKQTLTYSAPGAIAFGRSLTYSGLGSGLHELRILHRSGAVYVDGFRIQGGAGANASSVQFTAQQQDSSGSAAEGPVLLRSVTVGSSDVALSALVEGSSAPLTVKIVGPAGNVVASGGALLTGFSISGVDAPVSTTGTYTVQILGLGVADNVAISIVRGSRVQ